MKKYFFIATAALVALASCSKVNVETPEINQAISFQVANYMASTKATQSGVVFSTDDTFGTNAWYNASTAFMTNETVSYKTNAWTPSATYYWPKSGTIDFQSYYPAGTPWFALNDAKNVLSTSEITIAKTANLMYADKAVGLNANVNEVVDNKNPESNFTGVPTFFNHALAKLNVNVKANKLQDKTSNPDVIWVMKVNSVSINNVYATGSLSMDLATSTTTEHTYKWVLPTNSIWTPSTTAAKANIASDTEYSTTSPLTLTTSSQAVITNYTVLPQALSSTYGSQQTANLNVTIEAYNTAGQEAGTTPAHLFLTETIDFVIALNKDTTLPSTTDIADGTIVSKMPDTAPQYWQMNKNITYTIIIDPNTRAVTFDPAVNDWVNETEASVIVNE